MKTIRRIIFLTALVLAGIAAYTGWKLFGKATSNNLELRIRSNWTHEKLSGELQKKAGLRDGNSFVWWLKRLGYHSIKPCTVRIPAGTSVYQIAQILKANRYQTTDITILGSMKPLKLARLLDSKIEVNEETFIEELKNGKDLLATGFNDTTWPALMIPNTYNFSVATTQAGFFTRMKKEYDRFWNEERTGKAEKQGLNPLQVAVIASIVTKESNKTDEYENIAGVYINRLKKGMALQADPTIVFARGTEGRVLNKDLKIESPYNTYEHTGLPPGPICIPNLSALEAVLNYKGHSYLYFVADPSLNGYHHFSRTLAEHEVWAVKFRLAAWAKKKK